MVRWLGIVVVLVACSKSGNETQSQTKQWQAPAPPASASKDVVVPDGVSIAVDVDGAAKPAITSDTLKSVKPDFVDPEHHAWLVASLVPDAAAQGTIVEATAPTGVSVKLAHPTQDGLEPVLFLTRRGELTARAIDPKDPFPKWEGQGGRVHRPGDSLPHLGPIAKLAITRPTH